MNFEDLATNVEMEKQEFLEMIGLFLETSATDLRSLQAALEREENLQAAHAAHSIKGAAASLGLGEIYELTRRIETEVLTNHFGQTSERVLDLRETLDDMAEELRRELESQGKR